MMNWSALGAGGRALVGVGAAGIIGVSAYFVSQSTKAPAPDVVQTAVPEASPAVEPAAVAAPAPTTQVILPSFDLVRIDPLGNTTVAGNAAPSQPLSLRIDGAEIAQTVADPQGKFAALFTIAPNPNPRLLTLVAIGPDGTEVMAANSVAISPFGEPAPVAAVAAVEAPAEPAVAAQAPVALVLNEAGVEAIVKDTPTTQVADAAVPAGVTITAITYAPNGGVNLSGSGAPLAALRLYLDQAVVAETSVQSDGNWFVELSDVAPGIYTLRVDQLNAEGQVDARFQTPFKRETQQALAATTTAVGEPVAQASIDAVPVAAEPSKTEPSKTEPTNPEPAVGEPAPAEEVKTAEAPTATSQPAEVAIVGEAAAPQVAVETAAAPSAPITITVQPGFTLWRIAQDQLGQGIMYVQVFEANQGNIADPDLIYPGQIFTIPKLAD